MDSGILKKRKIENHYSNINSVYEMFKVTLMLSIEEWKLYVKTNRLPSLNVINEKNHHMEAM